MKSLNRFSRLTLPLALSVLLGACGSLSSSAATDGSSHQATSARQASAAGMPGERAESLVVEAFTPGEGALFSVASVMIKGREEVMLIDAQFSAADAQKLVDSIKASGKRLSTIYISHGDPDFYFGLATLKDAFPDARVLATPQTVEHIEKTKDGKLAYWGPQMGANAPAYLVVPEVLEGDTLTIEGQPVKIIGLDGPAPDRTVLWIPSIRTVVGGVPVVGQEHVWMADTQTPQSHQHWLGTLDQIAALKPDVVIPGHFADGAPLDLRSVQFTADYIRAFDEESAKARDSAALIEAMKRRYPGLPGEESLALSAKVDKGEMQWP